MENIKVVWVDYLRVIAIGMVVFLHSASPLLYKFNQLPLDYWLIANVYDSMVRVCVPLFFMVSGFLLLQKQEPLGFYFSKRFKKLLVPIIFWSLFFILWKNIVENGELPKFEQFYSLLLKPSYYHLWFLYALIGIYLFVPILRIVTNSTDNKLLVYYCLIWFLAVSVIPFI
ncbi:acyltransferase, partial [Psychromonas sp.]